MYSLNMPVAKIRTRMRQEFERHRYVAQVPIIDVLISKSDMEFQVGILPFHAENGHLTAFLGNHELLEAVITCIEILYGGKPESGSSS
jgi:hypothetical protein